MTATLAVDPAALEQVFRAGGIALCGNARLQRLAAESGAAGDSVALARAATFEQWLAQCWQEWLLRDGGLTPDADCLLCDAPREALAWERALAGFADVATPLRATAALALRAHRALNLWRVPLRDSAVVSAFQGSHEGERFLAWRDAFEAYCAQRRLLPELWAAERLIDAFASGRLARWPCLALVGMRPLSPLHAALVDAAAERVVHLEPPAPPAPVRIVACDETLDELSSAAHWAARWLARDPEVRLAVAVPELHSRRRTVDYVFGAVFDETAWRGAAPTYRIAAGMPLAEAPPVAAALLALRMNTASLATGDAVSLLRSPFFAPPGAPVTVDDTAAWIAELRAMRCEPLTRERLARWARPPPLFARLLSMSDATPTRAGLAAWAAQLASQLEGVGWPGPRLQSGVELQQCRRWRQLLQEASVRGVICGELTAAGAVATLHAMAAQVVFQPQRQREAQLRLDIVDSARGVGARFDALWMTGVTDRDWPKPVMPHPFIPLRLQRQLGMQGADAAGQLQRASELLDSHRRSAAQLWCSYARRDRDGELRPSALLAESQDADRESLRPWRPAWASAPPPGSMETVAAGDAPDCDARERADGSAGMLKSQSDCPFRAWAERRLAARALDTAPLGLDVSERGNLVHWALEEFWEGFEDSTALAATAEPARAAAVDAACEQAVARARGEARAGLGERFWRLERRRLVQLLTAWLAVELAAHDDEPFRVIARERALRGELGGMEFSLRIDRVDWFADQRVRLLDYKTGRLPSRPWADQRPSEPQLPLYAALYAPEPVGAIALAGLRGERGGQPPGYRQEAVDDGRLARWRSTLGRLAEDYLHGRCAVAPRGAEVCRHCDLHRLCRIGEQRAGGGPAAE